jgi:hypothetical protein
MINELLKEKLQRLADDELMIVALRAVFEERIEKTKPDISSGDSDEIIGQAYRAYLYAVNLLQEVFLDIESYKNKKGGSPPFNKET